MNKPGTRKALPRASTKPRTLPLLAPSGVVSEIFLNLATFLNFFSFGRRIIEFHKDLSPAEEAYRSPQLVICRSELLAGSSQVARCS